MSLLSVTNLEASYGPVIAVRGVSMTVEAGSIVTILGANGAGKTTILKTVSGVLEPLKGQITFDEKSLLGVPPHGVARRGIGHVPEGHEVFPLMTVRENLVLGSYVRQNRSVIAQDLERVFGYFPALRERSRQAAGLLSGGQQQMLALGRALMGGPRLLLLDEPSLGLSPILIDEIFAIIGEINRTLGTTILLVEQNAHIALHSAQYGYVLEAGRIVMEGPCSELLHKQDIREFYLGMQTEGVRGERRWKRRKTWR